MTVDKIKEINSIFYTSFRQLVKKPHSLAMCYLIFFMRLVENIIRLRFHYKKVGRILFFVPSLNNKTLSNEHSELSLKFKKGTIT